MNDQDEKVFEEAMKNEAFREMMKRIESSNAGQEKYAKKQYHMSQIAALANVIILAVVIYAASVVIPKVNATYQNMDVILKDIQVITSELAEADLDRMIDDVDKLAVTSQENIEGAMEKLNGIDIDGLNTAIKNLSDVVEPFAEFFGRFR